MLKELFERYPCLASCEEQIVEVRDRLVKCYKEGGKLLICGNGGSCSDSEHIVGELLKGFLKKRPLSDEQKAQMRARCSEIPEEWLSQLQGSLPAVALPSLLALNTAFCNDVNPELLYAQSIMGLAKKEDIVLCISTSGNSANAYAAAVVAKALGVTVIGLTGAKGGKIKTVADMSICVPETETFKVQELHLPVYHYLCAAVEAEFFKGE